MVRISVELPDEVAEALGRLAESLASTPENLLAEAAQDFVATRGQDSDRTDDGFDALLADPEAFAAYLAPALADVAGGRVVDHEDVMAEMDAWVAEVEARARQRP